ncbi:hypothetical protein, partial [Janthinobacterium sp. P210005]|uniref:hypothetical protein n=1 Tax=Janthinobacterium sp. P210005 TaxID=3112938 RepID=UPI002E25818A|nr:hypothetical protein [Janthinobacterium sp. P210005]
VKQLCADDSAATSVKVGYRQACYSKKPLPVIRLGFFYVWRFCPVRAFCRAYGEVARSYSSRALFAGGSVPQKCLSCPAHVANCGHRHVLFIFTLYDGLHGCCPWVASPFHPIK